MKGFLRFIGLVVFLGTAWVVIPLLVGRDKEPEKRLIGGLNFLQETIQYSRSVPFDLDVFDSPTITQESEPDVWSISATLAIPDGTGIVIREPYTAVVENVCQAYAESRCWRLVQLTIGDAVIGNRAGSIRAALEKIAPSISLEMNIASMAADETGAQPTKDQSSKALTAGTIQVTEPDRTLVSADATPGAPGAKEAAVAPDSKVTADSAAAEAPIEANKPATTQVSRTPATDDTGKITAPSTDGARAQPDQRLVRMIQRQLRDRGLDIGPLDGVMGSRTRSAIATFQYQHGLISDGIPSISLLNFLRNNPRGQDKIVTAGTQAQPQSLAEAAAAVRPGGRNQGAVTDQQVALGAANAGYMVELSAFGTAEATMRERKRLQEALSDLLGETELTVERISLGEGGVQYQVQAKHFPDRLTANYMCARVRARKRYCQVVTPASLARAISVAKTANAAFTDRSGDLSPSTQRDGSSYARAGVQAQNRGVFGKAIEFYSLAIETGDLSPKDLAHVYNNRGAAYKNMEFFDLAINDYHSAIRLKKDYARAYYNRGIAYGTKGLLVEAIKDYSTALRLKPNDAATYNNRGLAYDRANLHQKAIADFSQAIRLAPHLSYTYYNRGLAYEVTNDRQRAIDDFKKSYSLSPGSRIYQAKMKDIGLLQ